MQYLFKLSFENNTRYRFNAEKSADKDPKLSTVEAKITDEALSDEQVQAALKKLAENPLFQYLAERNKLADLVDKAVIASSWEQPGDDRAEGNPDMVDRSEFNGFITELEALVDSSMNEKLQQWQNKDLLRLPPEQRLALITKEGVSAQSVASGQVKELTINFTFDGEFNETLWRSTTAGQVLPKEVFAVESGGTTYQRRGFGEFFSASGERLKIHGGEEDGYTKINIAKLGTADEVKAWETKAQAQSQKALQQAGIEVGAENYDRLKKAAEMGALYGLDSKITLGLARSDYFEKITEQELFVTEFEQALTQAHRAQDGLQNYKAGERPNIYTVNLWLGKYFNSADSLKEFLKSIKNDQGESYYTAEEIKSLDDIEVSGNKISVQQAKRLAEKYFPGQNVLHVLAIMYGESGFKPSAGNRLADGRTHTGLMQISSLHRNNLIAEGIIKPELDYRVQLMNPDTNMKAARWVYNKQGWRAWEAGPDHKNEYYQRNLKAVRQMLG